MAVAGRYRATRCGCGLGGAGGMLFHQQEKEGGYKGRFRAGDWQTVQCWSSFLSLSPEGGDSTMIISHRREKPRHSG